jgi:neutral ceramidase
MNRLFSLREQTLRFNRRVLVAAAMVLAWSAANRALGATLRAGAAHVDLTPPLELKAALGGYGERLSKPATGVHDRVWAKALILREADRRFAFVTADALAFPPGLKTAVAEALAADGWKPEEILLLPSHTHTSLDMTALNPKNTFGIPQLGVFHKAVYDWTVAKLAAAVREAAKDPVPVVVGSATRSLEGWNRNRRGKTPVDRDLTLTRFDQETGAPLAVLVNWTAHPTFMEPEHMEFSGDWPGHLQRTLEALIGQGVTVLFYNGAEGDQSPTPRADGAPAWEQAERYGRELAIEAWRIWEGVKPKAAPAFAWQWERVALPKRVAHPDFMKTGGREYGLTEESVGQLLAVLCPTETRCVALRLGDLAILGVPAEMSAELGLQIKAAVRAKPGVRHVAIAGLADEWISYALSPEEYRRGGYEASVSFYGESLGPTLVEAAIRAADQIK